MAFASPRPTPKFFTEAQTFSTKKARGTPRECLPPRPPVKSAPQLSRVFGYRLRQKALPVSFRRVQNQNSLLNPNYDESIKELYFNQCFDVVSKIGAGSFGEVYKVKSKTDGQYYAVKESREAFRGESDRKRKLEEVAKHEKLRHHPNCVKFLQAWEEQGKLYLQTELCMTSLYDFAEKNHDIPEALIWKYLVDLLMAVKHLHNHNLVHMDIKSENIFLSFNDVCKLGDFGLVLDLSKSYDLLDAQEGDPKYLAPELLEGKFGKPADIFSLGMTILEISSDLDLPRGGEGWHLLRNGKIPEEFLQGRSFDLKYVIRQMLDHDPNSRPSVDQLLAFPCIRKVYKRRMREYMINNVVSKADHMLKSVVGFIFMFLMLIFTYPFLKMLKKKFRLGSSTAAPQVDVNQIDCGISDDETMNMNESSTSSLCIPLDNSSLEQSPDDECMLEQRCSMKAYTTPIIRRKWTSIISSRSVSPNFPRKLDLVSTPVTNLLESQCDNSSGKRPSTPIMMPEEGVRPIEPKNLLNMFDAAASDDDL